MNSKMSLNIKIYYLIIITLSVFILFLMKILLNYPFFMQIKNAMFNVFFPFIISFTIVYILHPVLFWFEKNFSIKTWVSTLVLLIINAAVLILLINFVLPILGKQILNIVLELPKYFDQTEEILAPLKAKYPFLNNPQISNGIITFRDFVVNNMGSSLTNFTINTIIFTFKSLWLLIMIPIIVFIMMKDYTLLHTKISTFLINHRKSDWIQLIKKIDKKLGIYIRGQFIIMGYMFILSFFPLLLIGVPNALLFSIIIIITNIIPYVGPFIGAIPLGIYTLFLYPHLLIPSMLLILVIQQLDGNIGKPLLFGSQLDMHPLIVIVVLILGGVFGSTIGILLALPIYIIIGECVSFYKESLIKT